MLIILLALVGLATLMVTTKPWLPLRHGRADPPAPSFEDLPAPVSQRIRRLRDAVADDPYSAEAWGRLGAVFEAHDLDPEAILCYERAQQLDSRDFRWPYFLGISRRVGNQRAALSNFQRALDLEDDYPPLHVHLGRAYFNHSQLEKAAAHFERALELDPDLIAAHLGRAQVALSRHRPEAALNHLSRALELGPRESQVHLQFAEAHRRLGRMDDARRHQQLAVGGSQQEPMADPVHGAWLLEHGATLDWYRRRAESALARKQPSLALAEWKQAAADYPLSPQPHAALGNIYVQLGRRPEAIASFHGALELDEHQALARNNLGSLLVATGEVEEGLGHLRRSAEELPRNADAHFNLAAAYLSLDRAEEAIEALQRVVEIDPEHARAHFELGRLLGSEGRQEQAAEHFRLVTELEPDRRSAYVNLARALDQLGRCGDAVPVLAGAHERWPDDASTAVTLAWHLATCPDDAARDGARAIEIMERFCRRAGCRDPRALDVLAAAYAEAGEWGSALATIERAREMIEPALERSASAELLSWLEIFDSREAAFHDHRAIRDGTGP